MNVKDQARIFATAAHAAVGQVRKYSGRPYIEHPIAVSKIVESVVKDDENMVAAALLHDVVEDTAITVDEIREEFGDDIAMLVDWLSDVSKPEDGNRKTRKAMDRAHSLAAPGRAQTIKLADIIHNAVDIVEHDKNFSKVFIGEVDLLVEGMKDADPEMRKKARKVMKDCKEKIFG